MTALARAADAIEPPVIKCFGLTLFLDTPKLPRSSRTPASPRPREIPRPRFGYVRVYRGTWTPDRLQKSASLRQLPPGTEVPSGEDDFLPLHLARTHALSGHPDGLSVTTDLTTARLNGSYVVAYDIPARIFARLPPGDLTQGERVFKYSIPEKWVIAVIPSAELAPAR